MTNYILHNTIKKKKEMSKTTRARYNHAAKQLHAKNPVNLKQAMNLVYWADKQN